eukprot:6206785-Heterocapsa_arctica.AAC.1
MRAEHLGDDGSDVHGAVVTSAASIDVCLQGRVDCGADPHAAPVEQRRSVAMLLRHRAWAPHDGEATLAPTARLHAVGGP